MNIFLTGATGFVGKQLSKELLAEDHHLYILCRSTQKAESFMEEMPSSLIGKVTCIKGDLSEKALGISEDKIEELSGRIDAVYHMAAYLSFDPSQKEETFNVNLEGTRHVMEFAEKAGCRKFLYVSTAYTVGMETEGKEELYSLDRSFVNHYEESKSHSEHLLFSHKNVSNMEIMILRPAIIIGDSRTGEAQTTFGLYGLLKAASLLKRKVSKRQDWEDHVYHFLGQRELKMNLVPVDYVTKVLRTALKHGEDGKIYNITDPSPLTQDEIFEAVKESLEFPNLNLVPHSKADSLTELEQAFNQSLTIFKHYFTREIHFPCDNTLALLNKAGEKPLSMNYKTLKFIIEGFNN
ncbi:SDR family oxidoreductase [Bacillus sp. SG-1]|uniref:SDR family oxidoreductase n=1 Tax=Bacillus sp. SG-1 TaxID=161544 RepID=UPI0001544BD1|nr:SDR family oxidoreductase [Bacillus sp. SG-1]EDL64251.1 short chain dehydrogenase [Bacillus sp. SG-1]